MDPDAMLKLLIEAIQDKDYEAAFNAAQGLKNWLSKGGLGVGGIANSVDLDVWCQVTMKLCKALEWERVREVGLNRLVAAPYKLGEKCMMAKTTKPRVHLLSVECNNKEELLKWIAIMNSSYNAINNTKLENFKYYEEFLNND